MSAEHVKLPRIVANCSLAQHAEETELPIKCNRAPDERMDGKFKHAKKIRKATSLLRCIAKLSTPSSRMKESIERRSKSDDTFSAKDYIGKHAKRVFLEIVRTQTQDIESRSQRHDRPSSPRHVFIRKCMRAGVIPNAGLVIKSKVHPRSLILRNRGLDRLQMRPFISAMKVRDRNNVYAYETIDLSHNRLDSKTAVRIIRSLGTQIRELDFASNLIKGGLICEQIKRSLCTRAYDLKELNLSSNMIGDLGGRALAEGIASCASLIRLNLSDCGLGQDAGRCLASAIAVSGSVAELDMSWNRIGTESAISMVSTCSSIKDLRLSFIRLGSARVSDCSVDRQRFERFVKALSTNKTLLHLDLSGCGLEATDVKCLNEGLKSNHTLLGLHLNGNIGATVTNALGFIVKEPPTWLNARCEGHHRVRSQADPKQRTAGLSDESVSLHVENESRKRSWLNLNACVLARSHDAENDIFPSCWICGGWSERSFSFNLPQRHASDGSKIDRGRLWVHFLCDDWKGEVVYAAPGARGEISHSRVLPPGRQYFFFIEKDAETGVSRYMLDEGKPKTLISAQLPPEKAKQIESIMECADDVSVRSHRISRFVSHERLDDIAKDRFASHAKKAREAQREAKNAGVYARTQGEARLSAAVDEVLYHRLRKKDIGDAKVLCKIRVNYIDVPRRENPLRIVHSIIRPKERSAQEWKLVAWNSTKLTLQLCGLGRIVASRLRLFSEVFDAIDCCELTLILMDVAWLVEDRVDDLLAEAAAVWPCSPKSRTPSKVGAKTMCFDSSKAAEFFSRGSAKDDSSPKLQVADLNASIWADRRKHNDARSFWNTPKLFARGLRSDWEQMYMISRVRNDAERQSIFALFLEHFADICDTICFWASTYCSNINRIDLSGFMKMCGMLHLENSRKSLSRGELQLIFKEANADMVSLRAEGTEHVQEHEMKDDRTLCRFELITALFLLARKLYGSDDAAESVKIFMRNNLRPFIEHTRKLCFEHMRHDLSPDVFRREHLYSLGVDFFVHETITELRSLFDAYATTSSSGSAGTTMNVRGFARMLADADLIVDDHRNLSGDATISSISASKDTTKRLSLRAAIFIFGQSQIVSVQPLNASLGCETLTIFDFIEAIARVASFVSHVEDTRPLELKLNDAWQFYFRRLLGKANEVERAVIRAMDRCSRRGLKVAAHKSKKPRKRISRRTTITDRIARITKRFAQGAYAPRVVAACRERRSIGSRALRGRCKARHRITQGGLSMRIAGHVHFY